MVEVGVKELKNRLSVYLRRVARGERIVVTMRGEPVAELGPAGGGRRELELDAEALRLAERGRIALPSAPKDREPAPPTRTGHSASDLILRDRAERGA